MNALYTITINRRKYVTTDKDEADKFAGLFGVDISINFFHLTTETIPNVIAL